MPDPGYEGQAKALLDTLNLSESMEHRGQMIAHAQVFATLEVAERLWTLQQAVERLERP